MQALLQILHTLPADLIGWVCVIAGLGAYACLVALSERRAAKRRLAPAQPTVPLRDARSDWARLVDIVENGLRQADTIAALHAAATDRIDGLEYAFGRLLEDCAKVMSVPVTQPMTTIHFLARESAPLRQQPLAA
jgi:hypothetical protein